MKHLSTAALLLIVLLLNLWVFQSALVGTLAFGYYVVLVSQHVSRMTKQAIAGPLLFLAFLIVAGTILYYLHGTTAVTVSIVLVLSFGAFLKQAQSVTFSFLSRIKQWKEQTLHPFRFTKHVALALLVLFLDTTLIGFLWMKRTYELMPSPWQAVDAGFFLVFTLATILLAYTVLTSKLKTLPYVLVSVHLFTMYAVAPVLYPLGYGFDAFVHRATEAWIFENGFISPKQPYYIGQYSLVVFLAKLTGLSIFVIDVYLVPLLAAILIPFTVARSYAARFEMPINHALVHILAIGLVPFLSFHLTTPHNLVILLSLLTVFTTILFQKNKLTWHIPLSLTIAALVTHPLIGAPIFGFFLTAALIKHTKSTLGKRVWLALSTLGQVALLPLMFTLNNLRTGNGWPIFGNPFHEIPRFFELFTRPYWYLDNAPIFWELVYAWERMIVPIAVIIALLGFILYKKKTEAEYLYLLTAVGLFLSAWLLRSWITFPDVVVYEQGDYPMRLVRASMLFLLPWFLYGLFRIANAFFVARDKYWRTLFVIAGACLLTVSFYFSYPQRNIKSRFPGFNVTQADFTAVEWIHNREAEKISPLLGGTEGGSSVAVQNPNIDYIVLSNQLVSSAALTNYSFAKSYQTSLGELFYYSVPTGGPLYQQYGKMLYQGQKREYMEAAMDLVGVDTSYFVLNSYWANADEIIEGSKKTADSWEVVGDGDVWVFVYEN